jgi:hypothetical protein
MGYGESADHFGRFTTYPCWHCWLVGMKHPPPPIESLPDLKRDPVKPVCMRRSRRHGLIDSYRLHTSSTRLHRRRWGHPLPTASPLMPWAMPRRMIPWELRPSTLLLVETLLREVKKVHARLAVMALPKAPCDSEPCGACDLQCPLCA